MRVVEAPSSYGKNADLFLAGGISNCPDWQKEALALLDGHDLLVLNPRRSGDFDESTADEQIRWEFEALRTANTVLFWFPKETLCPITLFELGAFSQMANTRLVVGTDPEYARRFDVLVQLELARPEVTVHDNLPALITDYLMQLNSR